MWWIFFFFFSFRNEIISTMIFSIHQVLHYFVSLSRGDAEHSWAGWQPLPHFPWPDENSCTVHLMGVFNSDIPREAGDLHSCCHHLPWSLFSAVSPGMLASHRLAKHPPSDQGCIQNSGLAWFHLTLHAVSTLLQPPAEGWKKVGSAPQLPCTFQASGKVSLPALTKDILKTVRSLWSALIVALQQLRSPPWLQHPDPAFLSSC